MALILHPEHPNQPNGLLARVEALERRLSFLVNPPAPDQVEAFGITLGQDMREAYRLAHRTEGNTFDRPQYTQVDPFVTASIDLDAHRVARQVISTYMKNRQKAIDRGVDDLDSWQDGYAGFRARQVLQYEYGRMYYLGQKAFFDRYQDQIGPVMCHVEPTDASPDICTALIKMGTVPLAVMMANPMPSHPNCPHRWACQPASKSFLNEARSLGLPEDFSTGLRDYVTQHRAYVQSLSTNRTRGGPPMRYQ